MPRFSDNGHSNDEIPDQFVDLSLRLSQQQYTGNGGSIRQQLAAFNGWNYIGINTKSMVGAGAESFIYDRRKEPDDKEEARHGLADADFRWWSLIENPSPWQTGSQLLMERIQQLGIHGTSMVWNVKNKNGKTKWRIPIPMALVSAIPPGYRPNMPYGGIRVHTFQWSSRHFNHALSQYSRQDGIYDREISISDITLTAFPHPVLRGDGYSPTTATQRWQELVAMAEAAQTGQYQRGPNKRVLIPYSMPTGQQNMLPTTEQLDTEQRKYDRRFKDTQSNVVIVPPNTSAQEVTMDPDSMQYAQSSELYGKAILAAQGVSMAAAGLTDSATYGSVAASMQAFVANTLQPTLDLIAAEDSAAIRKEEGPAFYVGYVAPKVADPELEQREKELGIQKAGVIAANPTAFTVNELRASIGEKPDPLGGKLLSEVNAALSLPPPPPPPRTPAAPGAPSPDDRPNNITGASPGTGDGSQPTQLRNLPRIEKAQRKSMIRVENIQPDHPPMIAFDLDGTLAATGEYVPGVIGEPRREMVELAKLLSHAGCNIVIYTARDEDDAVAAWLDRNEVPWCGINENPYVGPQSEAKMLFDVLIDDRVTNARTTEGIVLQGVLANIDSPEWSQRILAAINERQFDDRYGYLCAPIGGELAKKLRGVQAKLKPEHLAGGGIEKELHITVLYGMVGGYESEMTKVLSLIQQPKFRLSRTASVFGEAGSGKMAVVVELLGDDLSALNAVCSRSFPYIKTHDGYRPHITLGYVSEAEAEQYQGMSVPNAGGVVASLSYRHPSSPDLVIPLRG